MRRPLAMVLIAGILASCLTPPVTASPAASLAASSPPTSVATPNPSGGPSAPIGTARPGEIRIALDAEQFAANADGEVLIVARRSGDGRTSRVEAIELRSGITTTVRDFTGTGVTAPGLRDGVLTLQETNETGVPMDYRIRVLAGRWRDPTSFIVLDEFTVGLAGGDSWNPYPLPQTNGWEVAWLHTTPDRTFEVRLRGADGAIRTLYSSRQPLSFALGRYGDVAIADLALPGQTAPVALRLASGGAVRTLLERPATGSGLVLWQVGGRIVWSYGAGLVRPIPSIERITVATLAREDVTPPPGCFFGDATEERILFGCVDHVESDSSPPVRYGPPTPQAHPRALIRVDPGPPPIAFVAPVVADDPRPGVGARF